MLKKTEAEVVLQKCRGLIDALNGSGAVSRRFRHRASEKMDTVVAELLSFFQALKSGSLSPANIVERARQFMTIKELLIATALGTS